MKKIRRVAIDLVGVVGLGVLGAAHGADAVRGKALFSNTNGAPKSCGTVNCHAGFPAAKVRGIEKGTNPSTIVSAIAGNKGEMGFLSAYVNSVDAADIAAYIANPTAGTGSPAIALSATTLTFAAQTLGTTSAAQTVTVSNTGTAVLTLAGLTLGGTASAEFTRGGTCQPGTNVAVGGTCSIQCSLTHGAEEADLVIAKGGSPTQLLQAAMAPLGGMGRFVKKDQRVVIKANIAWARTPEQACTNNPHLFSALIKGCYDAGAKRVAVWDHTCDNYQFCFSRSGLKKVTQEAGGDIYSGHGRNVYKKVEIPKGKKLKEAEFIQDVLESDVYINFPLPKQHFATELTLGLKNTMGIIWDISAQDRPPSVHRRHQNDPQAGPGGG